MLLWLKKILKFFSKKNRNVSLPNTKSQIVLDLPKKLKKSINIHATGQYIKPEALIIKILENNIIPSDYIKPEIVKKGLPYLVEYLSKIPSVKIISHAKNPDQNWWVKFDIDTKHPLAWSVVQALGFVFNYISLSEKLPTVFMPVSPPPYFNGGPEECLAWVIESRIPYLDPKNITEILEGRLPRPVDDLSAWNTSGEDDDNEHG